MDLLIGRDTSCDIILDEPSVSSRHARLCVSDGRYLLEDLGSTNGTCVNGRTVQRAEVGTQDVVCLGQAVLHWPQLLSFLHDRGQGGIVTECLGVGVAAGHKELLTDITFRATGGQLVAVIGPSGAGKSTLLKTLIGQQVPSAGSVLHNGVSLRLSPGSVSNWVGYVPQEDTVHRELVLREALSFATELRIPGSAGATETLTRVINAAEMCELAPHLMKRVSTLSGGERKRASVAMELLTQPPVLVFDEPTSGLDPALERSLMQLFRTLADRGHLVIVTTHATRSLELCDRVLVLSGGRVAYFGSYASMGAFFGVSQPADLYGKLSDPLTCWAKFRRSHQFQQYVAQPIATSTPMPPCAPRRAAGPLWQAGILLRRYLAVLRGDPRNMAFLGLQAPVIAMIIALVFPKDAFSEGASLKHAGALLFVMVMAALWFGTSNAAREIVKERSILVRERTLGLSNAAYLLSKALPLMAIGLAQALILVLLVGLRTEWFGEAEAADAISLWLVLGLAAACGVAGGLLVSALTSSPDQAMSLTPVVLLPQVVFSGVFAAISEGSDLIQALSKTTAANWGYGAAGAVIDLNAKLAASPATAQLRQDMFDRHFSQSLLMLLGMTLVLMGLAYVAMQVRHE